MRRLPIEKAEKERLSVVPTSLLNIYNFRSEKISVLIDNSFDFIQFIL